VAALRHLLLVPITLLLRRRLASMTSDLLVPVGIDVAFITDVFPGTCNNQSKSGDSASSTCERLSKLVVLPVVLDRQ
jgi:hypothetical protein